MANSASTAYVQNSFTLNSIPYFSAKDMVNSFLSNKGSYQHIPTSVWFSKAAFQYMYDILNTITGSDGIRLYFARTIPDGKYTVVIVATTDGGVDPDDTTGRHIHNDYFLDYAASTGPIYTGQDIFGQLDKVTAKDGALLYSDLPPCPPGSDNCPETPHYISCSDAYIMVNNVGGEEVNANSEWFDKGVMRDILGQAPGGGGVRVYFSRNQKPVAPDSITRHGFLFIVTAPLAGGVQQDKYVCFEITPDYEYVKQRLLGGGDDNGEQCPTNCKGTILGGR